MRNLKWNGWNFEGVIETVSCKGKFVCLANSFVYEGEFEDNKIQGFGTMTYKNGDTYTGMWIDGEKTGAMQHVTSNGSEKITTQSMYVKDKEIRGPGVTTWASGPTHRGMYDENNRQTGPGVSTWDNGQSFAGDWVEYENSGYGEYTYNNGNKYIGEFTKGKRHGFGRYIYKSGKIEDRVWKNDKETSTECDMTQVLPRAELGLFLSGLLVSLSLIRHIIVC